MTKMLKTAGFLVALTLSGAASANKLHHGNKDTQGAARIGGQIDGSITSVDLARGRLVIRAADQSYVINALPNQLVGLRAGMQVTIPYTMERGAAWVPAQLGGGIADLESRAGQQQRSQGTIQDVDLAAGTVTVQDQQFHVHPKLLHRLSSGDQVSLQYVPVQGSNWIVNIEPTEQVGFGRDQQGAQGQFDTSGRPIFQRQQPQPQGAQQPPRNPYLQDMEELPLEEQDLGTQPQAMQPMQPDQQLEQDQGVMDQELQDQDQQIQQRQDERSNPQDQDVDY